LNLTREPEWRVWLQEGKEVKQIVVIIIASVFSFNLFPGCVNSSKQDQSDEIPVGARKQHDTRVVVVCKNRNGQYIEKSLHVSQSVTCGGATFELKDFTNIKKEDQYIAFPGQENELMKYLKKLEKH